MSIFDRPKPLTAVLLTGTQTNQVIGPEGPRLFRGCGITLFEVPEAEVPDEARGFMHAMFEAACESRCDLALAGNNFWPLPRNPRHCGGAVEFRFLSF